MARLLGLGALALAGQVLAQGNNAPTAITTTDTATSVTSAGASQMTAKTALKLAKRYTADEFYNEWDWFSDRDPTNGYVNYVSQGAAQSLGLAAKQPDGSFIMRADAENTASGRGRNSVRISSKAKFADGVYILDLNHMPTGCGTWPAWWTTVKDGWPKGGEIDLIEGANAYPSLTSNAYNVTSAAGFKDRQAGYPSENNVASLHIQENCNQDLTAYQTGTMGSNTCSALINGNTGCGAIFGGRSTYGTTTFGSGVNDVGGGWYAMWRDVKKSGGVYVYFWPRNAPNVPDDVRYGNTSTTNVEAWGQPAANLSIPTCKGELSNHVIVFNIAFCGDYAGNTYTASGCPQTCTSFVQNNPGGFSEAYWSINSLRVYTESGKPAAGDGLSAGAIAGIVVGVVAALAIVGFLVWRWRRKQAIKRNAAYTAQGSDTEDPATQRKAPIAWAGFDDTTGPSSSSRESLSYVPADHSEDQKKHRRKHHHGRKHHNGEGTVKDNDEMFDGIEGSDSRRSSRKKSEPTLIATRKPRTGKTVLRPGMTARNYLDGETPMGGSNNNSTENITEGFVMSARKGSSAWVG